MWDHFFQLLFPKDSESQKLLDNRKWGQKDVQTVPQKCTHNQSDKQTHGRTFRLIDQKALVQRADALKKIRNMYFSLTCFSISRGWVRFLLQLWSWLLSLDDEMPNTGERNLILIYDINIYAINICILYICYESTKVAIL